MDELSDFFDFSKPFKRITVPVGYHTERVDNDISVNQIVKRETIGDEYAKVYAEAERRQIGQAFSMPSTSKASSSRLNDLNDDMDFDDDDDDEIKPKIPRKEETLYKKYNFDRKENNDLPINDFRTKILTTIKNNIAVVLQGDTGCGKTTQVPQFILDDAYNRQEYCNIICTQPRRIAAISIADRVCSERKWKLGSVVGYQVGLHANASEDTRLLYCTTGILLQKLIKTKDMSCYTHVILDEVHERDQDMDFLLIIVRRLLITNSRNVKVILMSATINTHEFSDYFKFDLGSGFVSAPIVKVDTRRLYTVRDYYLDDLGRIVRDGDNIINYEEPGILDAMYKLCMKLIVICYELASQESDPSEPDEMNPSVLVFLPGINEIDKMELQLQKIAELTSMVKIFCIRLHSMISPDEQKLVFRKAPKKTMKVILATNIAESSITVPDVKYVIDFCLVKYLVTDSSTNLTTLQLNWASRASCKQRAGRAGRVTNGRVYRLVSKHFYYTMMDEHGTPEMTRCPLANIVLKAKLLDMGPPHAILGLAMDPPNLSDIRNTILALKEAGALYKTVNGKYQELDGDLTYIGRIMSALPIDIHISRLIILGYVFSVLDEAVIMAAGLSVKSIFSNPPRETIAAYSQKLAWSDGSGSDLFAILKAYTVWTNMKEQRNFDDEDTEASWARRYFINTKSMREMYLLINEIRDRLKHVGIKEATGPTRIRWLGSERTIILKIVIAGAFYPNYFLRSSSADSEYEREAFRVLNGRDPCNTVYFMGFETKYIGQLYVQQIKNIFKQAAIQEKNIEVRFEQGSQKILITFKNDIENDYKDANNLVLAIPGRIKYEVYKAIKIRQLRCPTSIKVMNAREDILWAQKKNLGIMRDGKWIPRKKEIKNPELVVIPSLFTKTVKGKVTHIEHCGKFWFQPITEAHRLREYEHDLNGPSSDIAPFNNPSEISKGLMVAAPFIESESTILYYRAKIINLVENDTELLSFRVLFVDYGNFEVFEIDKLRKLGRATNRLKDIPPRCFECFLSGIQPSSIKCPSGRWPNEAIREMQTFVDRGIVEIEVYSVVNGITSAILKGSGSLIFNDYLVKKGFAQYTEENYMSKNDHDIRMRKQRISDMMQDDEESQNDAYLRTLLDDGDYYTEPAPFEKCTKKIELRGPFSPLETKIYAATRIGGWKSVKIEQESVNSVMLDNDPQDRHERLIVAANATESGEKGTIIARQTTLMPNIHGFAPLVGLIFCPTMQIRRDKYKTKYVSILAGLGADDNEQSLFEEHDVVFNLDVELNSKDLETINQIRYCMDTILYTDPGSELPKAVPNTKNEMKMKIKHLIIELMEKPRKYIEIHRDAKEYMWSGNDEDDDLLVSENIYGDRSIFPFHFGKRLFNESFERIQMLRDHCDELRKLSQLDINTTQIVCQLCDQRIETVVQLRIHLLSQLHRDREYQIGYAK